MSKHLKFNASPAANAERAHYADSVGLDSILLSNAVAHLVSAHNDAKRAERSSFDSTVTVAVLAGVALGKAMLAGTYNADKPEKAFRDKFDAYAKRALFELYPVFQNVTPAVLAEMQGMATAARTARVNEIWADRKGRGGLNPIPKKISALAGKVIPHMALNHPDTLRTWAQMNDPAAQFAAGQAFIVKHYGGTYDAAMAGFAKPKGEKSSRVDSFLKYLGELQDIAELEKIAAAAAARLDDAKATAARIQRDLEGAEPPPNFDSVQPDDSAFYALDLDDDAAPVESDDDGAELIRATA